jgi:hypothetical protein
MAEQPTVEVRSRGAEADTASMTPPASADGEKISPDGASSSDLSDVELDPNLAPAVEEEIQPDHFYGGGKIPVFKPVSILPHLAGLDESSLSPPSLNGPTVVAATIGHGGIG